MDLQAGGHVSQHPADLCSNTRQRGNGNKRNQGRIAGELEPCRRLTAIPGIGPIIATATIAAIGNGAAFRKGRDFAAWLGVLPGEHSTGGKQKLTGTSTCQGRVR